MVEPLRRSDVHHDLRRRGWPSWSPRRSEPGTCLTSRCTSRAISEYAGVRGEHNPENLMRPWLRDSASAHLGKYRVAAVRHRRSLHPGPHRPVVLADAGVLRLLRLSAREARSSLKGIPFPAATCRSTPTAVSFPTAIPGGGCTSWRRFGNCAARPESGNSSRRRSGCTAPATVSSRQPHRSCPQNRAWVDDRLVAGGRSGRRSVLSGCQGRQADRPRCDSCDALRWPPLPGCPECRGRATTWVEVAPTGTVWSFVVYTAPLRVSLRRRFRTRSR